MRGNSIFLLMFVALIAACSKSDKAPPVVETDPLRMQLRAHSWCAMFDMDKQFTMVKRIIFDADSVYTDYLKFSEGKPTTRHVSAEVWPWKKEGKYYDRDYKGYQFRGKLESNPAGYVDPDIVEMSKKLFNRDVTANERITTNNMHDPYDFTTDEIYTFYPCSELVPNNEFETAETRPMIELIYAKAAARWQGSERHVMAQKLELKGPINSAPFKAVPVGTQWCNWHETLSQKHGLEYSVSVYTFGPTQVFESSLIEMHADENWLLPHLPPGSVQLPEVEVSTSGPIYDEPHTYSIVNGNIQIVDIPDPERKNVKIYTDYLRPVVDSEGTVALIYARNEADRVDDHDIYYSCSDQRPFELSPVFKQYMQAGLDELKARAK